MIHYDEYGNPTHEHEMLCLKSLEVASKVLKGNYISRLEIQFDDTGRKATFKVCFYGKRVRRNGKTVLKVWPIDHIKTANAELVYYANDELELELTHKHLGWDEFAINETNLLKSTTYMVLTFSVKRKKTT